MGVAILLTACHSKAPPETSSTPSAAAQPAPARPVPSFSAAEKVGMFAYPRNNQSRDQQLIDESDCYNAAQQQSGVDPAIPPPSGPSAGEVQAAEQAAANQAPQAQGGRARGAARGAAGGAAIGAISGNAGRGAAIGATAGTIRGGRKQREANAQSKNQAAQGAGSQLQQQYKQAKAAYNDQQNTFKRAFSACMDSRSYSIK